MARNLANFGLFQIGWFACVLGAAHGSPLLGPGAVAAILAIHLLLLSQSRREALLIGCVTLGGSALSWFNGTIGAVDFADGGIELGALPLWIVALWALFATALRHSLRWLAGRHWLGALFGLVGSPLSYMAAERLGGVTIHPEFVRGLLVLGVTWAVAVPLVVEAGVRVCGEEAT